MSSVNSVMPGYFSKGPQDDLKGIKIRQYKLNNKKTGYFSVFGHFYNIYSTRLLSFAKIILFGSNGEDFYSC